MHLRSKSKNARMWSYASLASLLIVVITIIAVVAYISTAVGATVSALNSIYNTNIG